MTKTARVGKEGRKAEVVGTGIENRVYEFEEKIAVYIGKNADDESVSIIYPGEEKSAKFMVEVMTPRENLIAEGEKLSLRNEKLQAVCNHWKAWEEELPSFSQYSKLLEIYNNGVIA